MNMDNTMRGLQNQMFGVFLFLTIFPQLVEQFCPLFCTQRTLYEARERPSKIYSWQSFIVANAIVEVAWNSVCSPSLFLLHAEVYLLIMMQLMSVFCFVCWYFPIGLYRNAEWTDQVHSRGITIFLHIWLFFTFTSTFAMMLIAGLPSPDIAGGVLTLIFIMMFAFNGILAGPDALPGFWIFMYRVNPFTYVVEGFLGTTLANAPITCASNEIVTFMPPNGTTCSEYLSDFLAAGHGKLLGDSGASTTECNYCAMSSTNDFLASITVKFANRWRDFGLVFVYVFFNIGAALFFYWLARVPKPKKIKKE